jgi:hypothetical protein
MSGRGRGAGIASNYGSMNLSKKFIKFTPILDRPVPANDDGFDNASSSRGVSGRGRGNGRFNEDNYGAPSNRGGRFNQSQRDNQNSPFQSNRGSEDRFENQRNNAVSNRK